MKYIYSLILLLYVSNMVFAQQDYSLDSIQVVSLHIPIDVDKSGRSITVLSAAEITELPVSSVEEVLRYVNGVNMNSRGGFGVQSDIGMRGSTFSQVLFLIDGVRWNEPLTAHFNNTIPIPLSEIYKIEILRGPASAVYGADAVGGIVHIKTKTFAKLEKKGLTTSGAAFYGENELFDVDAAIQYKRKKMAFSTGYKKTQANGEEFVNPNYIQGVSEKPLYHTDFDIESYTFAFRYEPSKPWSLNARFARDNRDFDAKYFYTRSTYDESRETTGSDFAQFVAKHAVNNHATQVSLGYKKTDDLFVFNPAFTPNSHVTNRWTGVLSHQIRTPRDHVFAFGSQFDNQTIESTDRGDHDQKQFELFATSSLQIGNDVSSMVSLRGGHNDDYGFTFTPQASFAYNHNNLVLRSSIGKAVRGADFTERYVSYNIPQLSAGRNVGNPDLDVEESVTIDLGADLALGRATNISGTIFYRDSKNLIDYTIVNADEVTNVTNLIPGENYFQARNVGSANTLGIELQTDFQWALNKVTNVKVLANYNYLHTTLDDDEVSKYLANHPNHNVSLTTKAKYKGFGFTWANKYIARNVEAVETINAAIPESYFVSKMNISAQIAKQFAIQLRATNVFNEDYQEILGSQMPGRWLSAGFRWNVD